MFKYIQISGFIQDQGFHETASKILRKADINTDKCVFISSRTDEFRANDERMHSISSWFKAIDIEFMEVSVLDERASKQDVEKELKGATCIYLMGGDTKRQMAFIIQNEIEETLRKHEGVIVGLSAGAINMAKLGLVESHVVPHFEKYQSDFVEKEIMPLTYDKIIYGLNDNAVIAHCDSGIVFDGDVFELKSGVMRQIS